MSWKNQASRERQQRQGLSKASSYPPVTAVLYTHLILCPFNMVEYPERNLAMIPGLVP
jgi:hypothetical protein